MTHGGNGHNGNGEEHGVTRDSFRALVAALERVPSRGGAGRATNGDGNGGNGGGNGGGEDGGDLGPRERLLLDALRRVSDMQTELTFKTTQEIARTFAHAMRENAELVLEATAALARRVSALEREVAALKSGQAQGASRTAPGESKGEPR